MSIKYYRLAKGETPPELWPEGDERMSELNRLCELLDEQGVEHQPTSVGIEFSLEGTWCFADESDDGSGLFAGYGFMPWMCCHMKDAEHALRWCRDALGLEQVPTHKAGEVDA